jgi:hypothetical protein
MEAMMPCVDDENFVDSFNSADIQGLKNMQGVCNTRGEMAHSDPGDGVCSLAVDGDRLCSDDPTTEETDYGAYGGSDTMADVCAKPCTQELLDCVDNPIVANNRAEIMPLINFCLQPLFDDTGAGDGVCSMLSVDSLCADAGMEPLWDDGATAV